MRITLFPADGATHMWANLIGTGENPFEKHRKGTKRQVQVRYSEGGYPFNWP